MVLNLERLRQRILGPPAQWCEDKQCFTIGVKRLRGVTRVAREKFFPKVKRVKAKLDFPERKAASGSGFSRGRRVDKEIETWVNTGKRPANAHKWTNDIMKALEREKLVPLRAQVVVHDEEVRLGTACDLVCASPRGGYAIIEIKTGFEGGYLNHSGVMHGALHGVPDSAFAQHQLQLMLTMYLFNKTFGVRSLEGYIVRASREGVYVYPARKKFAQVLPKVLRAITV